MGTDPSHFSFLSRCHGLVSITTIFPNILSDSIILHKVETSNQRDPNHAGRVSRPDSSTLVAWLLGWYRRRCTRYSARSIATARTVQLHVGCRISCSSWTMCSVCMPWPQPPVGVFFLRVQPATCELLRSCSPAWNLSLLASAREIVAWILDLAECG